MLHFLTVPSLNLKGTPPCWLASSSNFRVSAVASLSICRRGWCDYIHRSSVQWLCYVPEERLRVVLDSGAHEIYFRAVFVAGEQGKNLKARRLSLRKRCLYSRLANTLGMTSFPRREVCHLLTQQRFYRSLLEKICNGPGKLYFDELGHRPHSLRL